jgi:hypothetical protein
MKRSLLLVPALALAALVAAPVAAAPRASPESRTIVSPEFELAANNGFRAYVETYADGITLSIYRGAYFASYEVRGEITEAGLKARFGQLGSIDVTFEPTKTLSTSNPPKECEGEPWTKRAGFFVGTIEFSGEGDYVRIEAGRAKGEMSVTSEWQCPRRKGPRPPSPPPRARERSEPVEEPATLYAFSRRCRCTFAAFGVQDARGRGVSFFSGAKFENREGMKIGRGTFVKTGAPRFVFDHEAGTARVDPPQPFTGTATYKRRPHGRDLWRSTIRVPLLGADPVSFRGGSFRAGLKRDFPGD